MDISSYLNEIKKYKMLSLDEQKVLFSRMRGLDNYQMLSTAEDEACIRGIREDELAARAQVINSNLRLVISIVKRYWTPNNQWDLIQAGNHGLIEAVDRFDITKGYKFSTYAVRYINKRVFQHFRIDNGVIMKYEKRKMLETQGSPIVMTSLDDTISEEDPRTYESLLQSPDNHEDQIFLEDATALVTGYLRRLTPRQRMVLYNYFYKGMTQKEIGRLIGRTRAKISLDYIEALQKLRRAITASDRRGNLERMLLSTCA